MHYDLILAEKTKQFEDLAKKLHLTLFTKQDLNRLTIVEGADDLTIRGTLEHHKADILLDPHQGRPRDHMHFRNSGLNHVLCRFAHDTTIAIGITLRHASEANDLGKIIQNIKLCRKYKVNIIFLTLATTPYQLRNPRNFYHSFPLSRHYISPLLIL